MEVNPLQITLGRTIRKRRLSLGISQEAFADLIGIHRTYIGSVERGERNVSLQNLARIANALGIPLSVLLQETEQESHNAVKIEK